MVTVFDRKQVQLARNCLCSSKAVNLSEAYHIFIALDDFARAALLPLCPGVLFLNLSGRGFDYYQFCRVKLFIQLLLLFWNVETTACDDDLVFLKNPKELFREQSHIEAMIQTASLDFPRHYPWSSLNIGFMRVLPNEIAIALYQKWLNQALAKGRDLSQLALTNMLDKREVLVRDDTAWFNVSEYVSMNELFSLRYYDPLHVQNGVMMTSMARQFANMARQRNIGEPYVCHLSWIISRRKIQVFVNAGLWFLNANGDTCSTGPDKRLYDKWKK
jgi:hypothetical protein